MTDWLGNTTQLSYDPDGDLSEIQYPGGTDESYTYDDADLLSGITDQNGSTTLESDSYQYDEDDQLVAANSETVGHDPVLRVDSSELGGDDDSYGLSAGDEIQSLTENGVETSYAYNGDSELTSSSSPGDQTTYSYNAEEELTELDPSDNCDVTNSWNQAGELSGVSYCGLTASYTYNGDGLRMSKTDNGSTLQFTWDQSGSLPLVLEVGDDSFIYGPGGLTLEQVTSGTPSYFLHDWQGSTTALVSGSGSELVSYTYDAFGNTTSTTGSGYTPLQFQGQYLDPQTSMYYLQARYYDPALGQFISPDPLDADVPFAFAGDDPTGAGDPTGQMLAQAPGGTGPSAVAPPPAASEGAVQAAAYKVAVVAETTSAPVAATPAVAPQAVAVVPQTALTAVAAVSKPKAHRGCQGSVPGVGARPWGMLLQLWPAGAISTPARSLMSPLSGPSSEQPAGSVSSPLRLPV